MKRIALLCGLLLSLMSVAKPFAERSDVNAFVEMMHAKHKFEVTHLKEMFQQVQPNKKVLEITMRPAEAMTWARYQNLLINAKRVRDGVAFWQQYEQELSHLEQHYGVPPEVIVAIMGIESSYGQRAEIYPTFQTLATLAFDYQRRGKFFQSELEHFLLLAREHKWEPLGVKGSYNGALGSAQFMPSSYRHYAVSYAQDSRDLLHNVRDAMASIANYIAQHGWQRGEPVVHYADVATTAALSLIKKTQSSPKPQYRWAELEALGVKTAAHLKPNSRLSLMQFENQQGPEYWIGRKNFYVLTRYNRSNNYGMAVHLLGQKIQSQRARNGQS